MPAALDPMAPTKAVSTSDTPFTDTPTEAPAGTVSGPFTPPAPSVREPRHIPVLESSAALEVEPLSAQFKSDLTTTLNEMVERLGPKILDSEERIRTRIQAAQEVIVNELDTVVLSSKEIMLGVPHMDTFTEKTRRMAPAEVPTL